MKTRKILVAALVGMMIVPTFQSCKKSSKGKIDGTWKVVASTMTSSGESTDTNTSGNTSKSSWKSSETFDGSTVTGESSNTSGNPSVTYTTKNTAADVTESSTLAGSNDDVSSRTNTHSEDYTFVKDGTYTSETTDSETTVPTSSGGVAITNGAETVVKTTMSTTGQWSFLGGNKAADLKTNERIGLQQLTSKKTTTSTTTYTGGSYSSSSESDYTYTGSGMDEIWTITESKKKSLKISTAGTSTGTSSNSDTWGGTTTKSSGTNNYTREGTMELTQ